ncbi:SGNH/GDSL hydrolase family protein, partial [Actinospica durhamensis]
VALRLAGGEPGLRYANLAVRGKLIGQIRADQLAPAAAMRADLTSLAGGLNDIMRPGCDVEAVCAHIAHCASVLAGASGRLVLFHPIDFRRRMPSSARLWPKVERLIETADQLAEKHGAALVRLDEERVFDDARLWAADRIHLTGEGHRRVAEAVLEALGYEPSFDWRAPLPAPLSSSPLARRAAKTWSDIRWLVGFLAPWIKRRLTGKSSGDGMTPKRPELAPVD